MKSERPLCACGCGKGTKWDGYNWGTYLFGHHRKGKLRSIETKLKISQTLKNRQIKPKLLTRRCSNE